VDVGQALARTQPVRRCWREIVTAVPLLALVVVGLFWRPIAAEYLFLRGHFETGRAHYRSMERAYRLAPRNERNAYAYAMALSLRRPDPWQDPAAALVIEQRAIRIFAKDPCHYRWAALAAERLGLTDQALGYYRRALAVAQERTADDYRRWLGGRRPPAGHGRRLMVALREHGGEAGVTEIAAFLDSSDPALVAHAARTLAEMGETRYTDRIERALEHVTDSQDRTAIEEALQTLRGGGAVPEAEAAGEGGG
jgi:tetratricopeptide (TPR) repeat protein